ncbi:MAG: hypothetical protein Q9164_004719 [Protoblastenia rupestris]
MPLDPFTAISSSIATSIKLFEITYQLKAVDEQTRDLLSTTKHVNVNIYEARRLRRLKAASLSNKESNWMDGIISDTEDALRGIAQLIEPARVDMTMKEGMNFSTKFLWVFRDQPRVRDKHQRLNICHDSLTTVISSLYSKDVVVLAPTSEDKTILQPPPYDPEMERLFNWRMERKRRKTTMNLGEGAIRNSGLAGTRPSRATISSPPTTHVWRPLGNARHNPTDLPFVSQHDSSQTEPSPNAISELEAEAISCGTRSAYTCLTVNSTDAGESSQSTQGDEHHPDSQNFYKDIRSSTIMPFGPSSPTPTLPELIFDHADIPMDSELLYADTDGVELQDSEHPIPEMIASSLNESADSRPMSGFSSNLRSLSSLDLDAKTSESPMRPPKLPIGPSNAPKESYADSQPRSLGPFTSTADAGNQSPELDEVMLATAETERGGFATAVLDYGIMRRGKQGWLAFHATRSDVERT